MAQPQSVCAPEAHPQGVPVAAKRESESGSLCKSNAEAVTVAEKEERKSVWKSNSEVSCCFKFGSALGTFGKKLCGMARPDEEKGSSAPKGASAKGGWKTMPFIIGNETCEKLATIGLLTNMIIYLTKKFNMSNVTASYVVNIWSGTTSMSPILGAFVSDAYIGKFCTITIGCITSFIGMVLLTLTALFRQFRPPTCKDPGSASCIGPNTSQKALLYSSFALLTMGSAGIRPCSAAFGADQFDHNSEEGRKSIRKFFNWFYFTFTVAIMVSMTVIVYIQDSISWGLGLAIPTSFMLISIVCFILGRGLYIMVKPQGSPFTAFAQVIVAAIRKRHTKLPEDDSQYYDKPKSGISRTKFPLTNQFKFLNKACVIEATDWKEEGKPNPWTLCTIQQVEELKLLLRITPIWIGCIGGTVTTAQLSTYSVLQAQSMDRHLGKHFKIPAASFGIFGMLAFTIFVPIYEMFIIPFVERFTKDRKGITMLQRMGVGQAMSIAPMAVAAIVEKKRRAVAIAHGLADKPNAIVPMSALWLVPQYALSGIAEAFGVIGANEFIYSQFPEDMKSVAGAIFYLINGIGSYLSSVVVNVVHNTTGHDGHANWLAQNLNRGRLDLFYWLMAGITALTLVYFIAVACWYKYKHNVEVKVEEADFGNGQTELALQRLPAPPGDATAEENGQSEDTPAPGGDRGGAEKGQSRQDLS